ncbi:hypothetical protein PybrP1_006195 [[Pythium] brassicae (nom. inval.)]|nr:hypothetical protein PybrP1_006195 [[Pythium] brassicae (nom. inval.)]
METSYRDAQIKVDDARGTFLEIVANKVMPFDMEATATAVWQHMTHSMQNIPLRFYYEKHPQQMETTDDTVLERIGAELYVNGKKADFQVKQIIRRHVEPDRVVLIWGAHIDSLEFCDEPTAGIRFREKGYLMIKRPTARAPERPDETERLAASENFAHVNRFRVFVTLEVGEQPSKLSRSLEAVELPHVHCRHHLVTILRWSLLPPPLAVSIAQFLQVTLFSRMAVRCVRNGCRRFKNFIFSREVSLAPEESHVRCMATRGKPSEP